MKKRGCEPPPDALPSVTVMFRTVSTRCMLIDGAHVAAVSWRPLPAQLQLTIDAASGV